MFSFSTIPSGSWICKSEKLTFPCTCADKENGRDCKYWIWVLKTSIGYYIFGMDHKPIKQGLIISFNDTGHYPSIRVLNHLLGMTLWLLNCYRVKNSSAKRDPPLIQQRPLKELWKNILLFHTPDKPYITPHSKDEVSTSNSFWAVTS